MAWDTVSILVTIAIAGIAIFIFYGALKRPIDLMFHAIGMFFSWVGGLFSNEQVYSRGIQYE